MNKLEFCRNTLINMEAKINSLKAENEKLREIDSEPKLHIHALNITIADKDAEIEQLKYNINSLKADLVFLSEPLNGGKGISINDLTRLKSVANKYKVE